jgi:thiol-disulfide isomerase/thioredoxin
VILQLLKSEFAVARLGPAEAIPEWARGEFVSITRTEDELSIVCEAGAEGRRGFRCLKIEGPLDFSLVGVLASIRRCAGAGECRDFYDLNIRYRLCFGAADGSCPSDRGARRRRACREKMISMRRVLAILFLSCAAFAQPEKWPSALEADVKSGSWAAAERVAQAIAEEIDAGRMFTSFADVAEEAKIRGLFAQALEHNGKNAETQRCLARQIVDPRTDAPCARAAEVERDRRIATLKADVLASEVKIPAAIPFARRGMTTVIAFSASWCAPCVKELDELRKWNHPSAEVVMLDVDQFSGAEKSKFMRLESLLGPEVPRLYVIDRDGRIRFQFVGFDDDGFFTRKLDWMVNALSVE